ncbi:copper uptake system-associated protein [Pseudomonas qingdaonensis]|uniref:Copper uptake system-associated protein n=1 Tax=Pseudomonas qingdaonensis TaxID=2056231 RepID=A0ABX8DWE7_9PSED|nr:MULTISPECIES: copper uptake system-associated protein [Pseudomonas]MDD1954335.1 copper uptake system-associated protein [Pseudomonas sp. 8209]QVL20324.1 copper uptake system-associated protein [Pseudomonas qingdaonensis]
MKAPILALLLACSPLLAMADIASEQQSIQQLMRHSFERPDAPLDVGPVTVEGDHAVAGWLQDKRGGRALLRKGPHGWRVVLCAGDSLLNPSTLRSAGLSDADATQLSQAVRSAEATQSEERVKQFALFQGVVKVDKDPGHGNH